MSIYDIKISEITTQYVNYVREMEEADIVLSSEFMVLAAELLEIIQDAAAEDSHGGCRW